MKQKSCLRSLASSSTERHGPRADCSNASRPVLTSDIAPVMLQIQITAAWQSLELKCFFHYLQRNQFEVLSKKFRMFVRGPAFLS